jgi:hypothetical protein
LRGPSPDFDCRPSGDHLAEIQRSQIVNKALFPAPEILSSAINQVEAV